MDGTRNNTKFHLCPEGERLYLDWSALLDQTRPKAGRKTIAAAKRAYFDHRAACQFCTPLEGKGEG